MPWVPLSKALNKTSLGYMVTSRRDCIAAGWGAQCDAVSQDGECDAVGRDGHRDAVSRDALCDAVSRDAQCGVLGWLRGQVITLLAHEDWLL